MMFFVRSRKFVFIAMKWMQLMETDGVRFEDGEKVEY